MSNTILNKGYLILVCFLYFLQPTVAQENNTEFLNYLYRTKQFRHLISYSQYLNEGPANSISADSIRYLTAKSHFQLKEYEASNKNLTVITQSFNAYNETRFLMSANANQLDNYDDARKALEDINPTDSITEGFKYFELSGIALLNRDLKKYYSYDTLIKTDYYFYETERQSLAQIANNFSQRKEKSPFVGGLLSAVIPGAGRFYAGKRGQAIYSFVISAFLGLQTWESYQKNGVNSARFITYGSLFSLFHIGNIWGSALSVKNYNNEYNEAADYRIKMDLLIPIRSLYK